MLAHSKIIAQFGLPLIAASIKGIHKSMHKTAHKQERETVSPATFKYNSSISVNTLYTATFTKPPERSIQANNQKLRLTRVPYTTLTMHIDNDAR
jgi:hypothetical protein